MKKLTTLKYNRVTRVIYSVAKKYINFFEGFSYNFEKNGEKRFLDELAQANIKIVFDVGSNIGEWCQIVDDVFQSPEIHCFELSPDTYETLTKNVNKIENAILNNFGLADFCGEIEYKNFGKDSPVNTILAASKLHEDVNKAEVCVSTVKTGDQYCKEHNIKRIDLLKIDVEGAEYSVLVGFENLIKTGSVAIIQFEYGYTNAHSKRLMLDFYEMLQKYGYVIGPLKPHGVIFMDFVDKLNSFNSGPNFVAVHESYPHIINLIAGAEMPDFSQT